jgi:hypothetical protein
MNYNENKPEQNENPENALAVASVASTSRRTITAVLVLIAALLLGYILYDTLLSHPRKTQVAEQAASVNESLEEEKNTEYSPTEKTVILEAVNETESEVSVAEAEEQRAILETMDTESDDETSVEDRKAILNAMQ